MSQEERYGTRNGAYSAWHRARSIARFVGLERAQSLSLVDADVVLYLELDACTREPLALIETAMDVGQTHKPATATAKLAQLAGLASYTVLYSCASSPNPADPTCKDLASVRVQRTWPAPEVGWRTLTPMAWAHAILQIRHWAAERIGAEPANDPLWEKVPRQEVLFERTNP